MGSIVTKQAAKSRARAPSKGVTCQPKLFITWENPVVTPLPRFLFKVRGFQVTHRPESKPGRRQAFEASPNQKSERWAAVAPIHALGKSALEMFMDI